MKQRYDSYKPSGIEWIGEIPSHWQIVPLKYVLDNLDYLREPISADERERNNPIYDYYGASGVIDKIDYYNVEDTVLLIGEDGANLVMRNLPLIYKATGKFWVNNHAHILKPKYDNSYQYLAHLLEAGDYSLYITGSAQPKLSQENLNNFILCIPPLFEQEAIAAWLDEKCGEIDAAVAKVDREIELIDELKRSEISRVVTRGLNPNVKLRPSGIDWIGDIPDHWKKCRFKNFIYLQTKPSTSEVKIGLENIESKSARYISTESEFEGDGVEFNIGDIVYGKLRPYLQKVWLAEFDGNAVGDFFIFKVFGNTHNAYVKYLLLSDGFTKEADGSTVGAKMPRVSSDFIFNMPFYLPPLAEQQAIADYLDMKCAEIDGLKSKLKKKRDTLVELRQSMISEVVTGKRKVI